MAIGRSVHEIQTETLSHYAAINNMPHHSQYGAAPVIIGDLIPFSARGGGALDKSSLRMRRKHVLGRVVSIYGSLAHRYFARPRNQWCIHNGG